MSFCLRRPGALARAPLLAWRAVKDGARPGFSLFFLEIVDFSVSFACAAGAKGVSRA